MRRSRADAPRRLPFITAILALLFVAACSGTLVPITEPPATPTPTPEPTASPTPTPAPSGSGEPSPSGPPEPVAVDLAIDTGAGAEEYTFVPTALTAPAGSTITLTLTNRTDPDDEIGHNWVLVQPGQEASVLANGIAAGDDNDWLDDADPGIIAATRLIEGDSDDDVTFEAPAPGTYTFVCTFPDHYAGGMQGTLTIS